jgi:hypothetical protein
MRRPASTLLVALLVFSATAASAEAGSVQLQFSHQVEYLTPRGPVNYASYRLVFTAGAGEANNLTATGTRLRDTSAPLSAGPNCAAQGAEVVCTAPANGQTEARTYNLGDGNDRIALDAGGSVVTTGPGADVVSADARGVVTVSYADRTAAVATSFDGVANDGEPGEGDQLGPGVDGVQGGTGNDSLTGSGGVDFLAGGPGNDIVRGLAGDDSLKGEDGNDTMEGGDGDEYFTPDPGADTIRGGGGSDTVSYMQSDRVPVSATLDDLPGDGRPGENDNAGTDNETLRGNLGDDRLTGSDDRETLDGEGGNDTLDGRGGNDSLVDSDGTNTFIAGPGRDALTGPGVLDTVQTRDGEQDKLDCFQEGIRPIDGDAIDLGNECLAGLAIRARDRKRAALSGRAVRLRVMCLDRRAVCSGRVRLRSRGRTVGSARVRFAGRRARHVRVKLSRRAARRLRAQRRPRLTVAFTTVRSLPAESRRRSQTVRLR